MADTTLIPRSMRLRLFNQIIDHNPAVTAQELNAAQDALEGLFVADALVTGWIAGEWDFCWKRGLAVKAMCHA